LMKFSFERLSCRAFALKSSTIAAFEMESSCDCVKQIKCNVSDWKKFVRE
jgi:hypothetical protein